MKKIKFKTKHNISFLVKKFIKYFIYLSLNIFLTSLYIFLFIAFENNFDFTPEFNLFLSFVSLMQFSIFILYILYKETGNLYFRLGFWLAIIFEIFFIPIFFIFVI
ncbi:MAG: hypothetical protein ACRC9U_00160 [Metamycoplasmataceae bacterium]